MPKRVLTSVYLPHAPERVWDVLADFARYAEWNPLNLAAEGEAQPGAKVRMRFLDPARPGVTVAQTVTITRADRGRALAWRGHVPLLFTGNHLFDLRPEARGTRLHHSETLAGLVAWRLSENLIERQFVPAYQACNRALAERLNAMENIFPLRLAAIR